jgi:hypothetical protein
MGCSLRKVHQLLSQIHWQNYAQDHSRASVQPDLPDNCNIRTTTGSCLFAALKHMEVQGFMSKKERLEKMHRTWLPAIKYYNTLSRSAAVCHPHSFVTLSPPAAVYTDR